MTSPRQRRKPIREQGEHSATRGPNSGKHNFADCVGDSSTIVIIRGEERPSLSDRLRLRRPERLPPRRWVHGRAACLRLIPSLATRDHLAG